MAKRSTDIPVKILPSAPRPVSEVPAIAQQAPTKKKSATPATRSTPAETEAHKRKMMWWIVGAGIVVALVVWIKVLPLQYRQPSQADTAFQKFFDLFRGRPSDTTPAEEEIRSLDQQVFPEFQ